MRGNDDDIKIFHPIKKSGTDIELTQLAALLDEHRSNGNITKAVFLGERLAGFIPEDIFCDEIKKLKNNEIVQLRALMIFSFQLALHKYLPLQILSTQAVNSMYAKLEETVPGFFSSISDGSAFSFYYLSIKKTGDVETDIGRNYAKICDDDDNAFLINLGKEAFNKSESKTIELIENFEFEN